MRPLVILMVLASLLGGQQIVVVKKKAGGGGGAAIVQAKSFLSSSSSATCAITFDSAPTSGNLIVLVGVADDYRVGTPNSSSFSLAIAAEDYTGTYIFYKVAGAGEPSTVTLTIGSATSCALYGYEVSGVNTLDGTGSAVNQGGGSAVSTGTTGTTATANEFVVAVIGLSSAGGPLSNVTSWTNSFTTNFEGNATGSAASVHLATAARIVSSIGTYTTTATLGSSTSEGSGAIATFR